MSAFDVIIKRESVCIISDGAGVDHDGRIQFVANKVHTIPHLNAVIAVRGPSTAGPFIAPVLGSNATSYDNLKATAAETIRAAVDQLAPLFAGAPLAEKIDLLMAGISERDGPDAFLLTSYGGFDTPAWTNIQLAGLSNLPGDPSIIAALGLRAGATAEDIDPIAGGAAMLEAKRAQPSRYFVGCFGQATTVFRDRIEQRIIARWPDDVIGTKLGDVPEAAHRGSGVTPDLAQAGR